MRAARGRAGQARGADREGQGRRDLPAPGMYPHQGPAAFGRGRRPGARERDIRRPVQLRRHRHVGRARVQGQGRRPALEGPAVHDRQPEDRDHRRLRAAHFADPGPGRRHHLRGRAHRAGHRVGAEEPARPGPRRRARDLQRRRAAVRARAQLGDHPGRRRHRRRVRQRVALLRGRGHDRGDAAPAAATGRRVEREAAAARVPPPGHRLRARRQFREREAHRHRRDRGAGRGQDARRRPAPGRGRPQPGLGRPGLRGSRRGAGTRLRQGGRGSAGPASRPSPRSGT